MFCLAALSFQIAHSHIAVKFSQSENFPSAFFCFEKSKENFFIFFVALICYKDIIAKSLWICQAFF